MTGVFSGAPVFLNSRGPLLVTSVKKRTNKEGARRPSPAARYDCVEFLSCMSELSPAVLCAAQRATALGENTTEAAPSPSHAALAFHRRSPAWLPLFCEELASLWRVGAYIIPLSYLSGAPHRPFAEMPTRLRQRVRQLPHRAESAARSGASGGTLLHVTSGRRLSSDPPLLLLFFLSLPGPTAALYNGWTSPLAGCSTAGAVRASLRVHTI